MATCLREGIVYKRHLFERIEEGGDPMADEFDGVEVDLCQRCGKRRDLPRLAYRPGTRLWRKIMAWRVEYWKESGKPIHLLEWTKGYG